MLLAFNPLGHKIPALVTWCSFPDTPELADANLLDKLKLTNLLHAAWKAPATAVGHQTEVAATGRATQRCDLSMIDKFNCFMTMRAANIENPRRRTPQRIEQLFHPVAMREEVAQVVGQIRIPCKQRFPIRRLPASTARTNSATTSSRRSSREWVLSTSPPDMQLFVQQLVELFQTTMQKSTDSRFTAPETFRRFRQPQSLQMMQNDRLSLTLR